MKEGHYQLGDLDLVCTGRLVKQVKIRSEYFVSVLDPAGLVREIAAAPFRADILTFVQGVHDLEPHYPYRCEYDNMAVLRVSTYDHWWTHQLNDKTRNMVRKAQRSDIVVRLAPFTDDLLRGIKAVYDETEVRQGSANIHYGKDIERIRREHSSFLDRSVFIGAYLGDELVGFIKIVFSEKFATIMNIVAMVRERNRATSNALMAKAVEICAERGVGFLIYSWWHNPRLRRFKQSNGFECFEVPRYVVPLTVVGHIALRLGLHRSLKDRMGYEWRDRFSRWRFEIRSFMNRKHRHANGAVAQSAERRGESHGDGGASPPCSTNLG